METKKKVYDFPFDKVRGQVVSAFRKHESRGTVADVVGLSGLPKYQVETVLPAVVADCRGQMAVTESGEILYKFPQGFSNSQKSLGKKVLHWTAKVLAALFKAWIMVMLVGYFVLFVLILLIALVVSIAISFMRRDDDQEGAAVGEFMGFFMVGRVIEFFTLLWLFSGDLEQKSLKKKKPFHRAIFEFVFGTEEKPEIREKMERKAFVSFVRDHRGSITLEELMALTGKGRREADSFISRLMLEFEGEPKVSENGTLYFFFPELLKTSGTSEKNYLLNDQELIPFTRNPSKTNNWIIFLNGFNLVFGAYFLAFGLQGFDSVLAAGDKLSILYLITITVVQVFGHLGTPALANGWVTAVLGVVPVAYSAFFFGIPAVRWWREGVKNLAIKTNNFRKKLVTVVLARPTDVHLELIEPDNVRNAPGKPADRPALKETLLRDLAGERPVDIIGTGPYVYSVPELEREQQDVELIRKNTDLSQFALGEVVFDTESKIE